MKKESLVESRKPGQSHMNTWFGGRKGQIFLTNFFKSFGQVLRDSLGASPIKLFERLGVFTNENMLGGKLQLFIAKA